MADYCPGGAGAGAGGGVSAIMNIVHGYICVTIHDTKVKEESCDDMGFPISVS